MPRIGAAWIVCCLIGCADLGLSGTDDKSSPLTDESDPPMAEPISFWKDIAPMFVGKCTLCHHPDNPTGVDLTRPFDPDVGIIKRETSTQSKHHLIVDPGHPERSFLIDKVSGQTLDANTEGSQMPLVLPSLDSAEVAEVRDWISDGANDDDRFHDKVAPLFGDGASLDTMGRCSICHYSGSSLPDLTDALGKHGVVGRTDSRGDVLVEPGDPDGSLLVQKIEGTVTAGLSMPLWLEPFSPHEVDLIERWIREGAREK